MSTPDTSEYTGEAGKVYLQAGQTYAVTSTSPILIAIQPEGGGSQDIQLVALTEQVRGAFEFTSTVTGSGVLLVKQEDPGSTVYDRPVVRAVFNRAPGASSSGTGGSSSSSAPTPPWVAYNAARSEITAADFSGLTNGDYMFYRWRLAEFRFLLPDIKTATDMLRESPTMKAVDITAPVMTMCQRMVYNCVNLREVSVVAPELNEADQMCSSNNLLTRVKLEAPKITRAEFLCGNCPQLEEFEGSLENVVYGTGAFYNNKKLKLSEMSLKNLEVGDNMFFNCNQFTDFMTELQSLTTGVNMFSGCRLTAVAVISIAATLPQFVGEGCCSSPPTITIGYQNDNSEQLERAFLMIRNKGWVLVVQQND